jgi:hypothetical protein
MWVLLLLVLATSSGADAATAAWTDLTDTPGFASLASSYGFMFGCAAPNPNPAVSNATHAEVWAITTNNRLVRFQVAKNTTNPAGRPDVQITSWPVSATIGGVPFPPIYSACAVLTSPPTFHIVGGEKGGSASRARFYVELSSLTWGSDSFPGAVPDAARPYSAATDDWLLVVNDWSADVLVVNSSTVAGILMVPTVVLAAGPSSSPQATQAFMSHFSPHCPKNGLTEFLVFGGWRDSYREHNLNVHKLTYNARASQVVWELLPRSNNSRFGFENPYNGFFHPCLGLLAFTQMADNIDFFDEQFSSWGDVALTSTNPSLLGRALTSPVFGGEDLFVITSSDVSWGLNILQFNASCPNCTAIGNNPSGTTGFSCQSTRIGTQTPPSSGRDIVSNRFCTQKVTTFDPITVQELGIFGGYGKFRKFFSFSP